jgi:LacI family transcriptional regulator, galactose operon repressor
MNIRDIAKLTGFSSATVSRVLNGNYNLESDTYKKVKEVLDSSGYVRKKAVPFVGTILCVDAYEENGISEHGKQLLISLENFASRNKIRLLTIHNNQAERIQENITTMNVSGIIYLGIKKIVRDFSLPTIALNSYFLDPQYSSVDCDDIAGLCKAFECLKENGHTKIAYFSAQKINHLNVCPRYAQIEFVYKYSEIEYNKTYIWDTDLIPGKEVQIFDKFAKQYLSMKKEERPTALVLCGDTYAPYAYNAFKNAGISIPDDISLVGFDNDPFCEKLFPSLTTVSKPLYEMAEKTMTLIMEMIKNKKIIHQRVLISPELIVRNSVSKIKQGEK